MNSSCKKCGGQIIFEKGNKYSKCEYCGFQNYFSNYNEIGNRKIVIFLVIFITFIILLILLYFFNKKDDVIINNGNITNYNAENIVVENNTIEKQIIIEKGVLKDENIDLFNCTNLESTRRFKFKFLTPQEQIIKSESNLGVSFFSNNLLKVKFYYLVGEEKKGKWITESQIKISDMQIYGTTYNQTPTNYTLINIPKKLDGKKIRIVAYGFDVNYTCKVRVESDQTIYVQSYFDLSKQNIGKNIDLIVEDIILYDKNKNDLGKQFSKDKIVFFAPIIKNIGNDKVNINYDNLKFSVHLNNGDINILNGYSKCTNTNITLNSGDLYTCMGGIGGGYGHGLFKEKNKKISIGIDYGDNIKETNENNNFGSIIVDIVD